MPLGETITRTRESGEEYTVYTCRTCETEHDYEYEAMECCVFWCENCGSWYETEEALASCCQYECEDCGARYSDAEDAATCCEEVRARDALFSPRYPREIEQVEPEISLYVEPIPDVRPARLCSIEQELSRGGAASARLLHRLGLSSYDSILSYSQDGLPGQAFVKSDGTLPEGGGEVVYSRFNLAHPRDARNVSKAVACLRALEGEDIVEISEQAGVHVHISALDIQHGNVFGPAQMAALWEIFSFSEDVIYRLGAAGWPDHRGTEYTRILPKMNRPDLGGFTAGKISKEAQQHRYFSINFRRLLDAVARCTCGACVVGDWAECDCGTLQRGTIEWRVFNATTDPEILHSWVLLSHGMTAAAFDHQIGTLSANEFGRTDSELHPWIFGWMLWNCPFQDSERQLLFNTARKAPGLNLPWDNIDLFHENWGAIEAPEVTAPEVFEDEGISDEEDLDPFESGDEGFYDDEEDMDPEICPCDDCQEWRRNNQVSDPVVLTNASVSFREMPQPISFSYANLQRAADNLEAANNLLATNPRWTGRFNSQGIWTDTNATEEATEEDSETGA